MIFQLICKWYQSEDSYCPVTGPDPLNGSHDMPFCVKFPKQNLCKRKTCSDHIVYVRFMLYLMQYCISVINFILTAHIFSIFSHQRSRILKEANLRRRSHPLLAEARPRKRYIIAFMHNKVTHLSME